MCNVLVKAKKSFDIRIYADAPHGFLNDTMPGRYRAAQTQAAWGQILGSLDVMLNKGWNGERVIWHLESDTSVHYDFTKNRRWE
jgi:carboxymethylenebutenolidase